MFILHFLFTAKKQSSHQQQATTPTSHASAASSLSLASSTTSSATPSTASGAPATTTPGPVVSAAASSTSGTPSSASGAGSGGAAATGGGGGGGAKSNVKVDNILLTRPLFEKTNTALVKLRRDIKTQKLKGWPTYKLDIIKSTLPIPIDLSQYSKADDWLPNDDFIVLHVSVTFLNVVPNCFCFI